MRDSLENCMRVRLSVISWFKYGFFYSLESARAPPLVGSLRDPTTPAPACVSVKLMPLALAKHHGVRRHPV